MPVIYILHFQDEGRSPTSCHQISSLVEQSNGRSSANSETPSTPPIMVNVKGSKLNGHSTEPNDARYLYCPSHAGKPNNLISWFPTKILKETTFPNPDGSVLLQDDENIIL